MESIVCDRRDISYSQKCLAVNILKRSLQKVNQRTCEICNYAGDVKMMPLFDLRRPTDDLEEYCKSIGKQFPSCLSDAEMGLWSCFNCDVLYNLNPPEIGIKPNGTIELFGVSKQIKYGRNGGLHGKKVPWANDIGKGGWPSSELLRLVGNYPKLKPKRKAKDVCKEGCQSSDTATATLPVKRVKWNLASS